MLVEEDVVGGAQKWRDQLRRPAAAFPFVQEGEAEKEKGRDQNHVSGGEEKKAETALSGEQGAQGNEAAQQAGQADRQEGALESDGNRAQAPARPDPDGDRGRQGDQEQQPGQ